MRLIELSVEDFKRIVFLHMKIRPGITEISGPNGAGKSSALDAIEIWLDGLKVKDAPTEPIRNGAKRSRVRGRLGDMYVIRTITPRKGGGHETEIRFEPAEGPSKGKAYPATQKMLNDLIGEHNLDPLDFVRLDMKGKFDALKVFVPNFDFGLVAQNQAADRARRKEVNELAEESRAAANMITVPDGTPGELIDEQALIRELQQAGERNADRERRQANRDRVIETVRVAREAASNVDAAILAATMASEATRDQEVARIEEQIETLRRQIDRIKTECADRIAHEAERLRAQARDALTRAGELQAKLDAADPLPEPVDTAALSQQIQLARDTNRAVMRAKERARYLAIAEQYEKESQTLTAQMRTREAAKQRAIAEAQLPIPGIEFGDGEIRYRGAPLEQASTAQKLRVAVARMVALNPKLRLGWIRDASLLDDDSYAELNRLANEHEIDILIETVRPIGKDAVVLCEGRLKSDADEQPQATLV